MVQGIISDVDGTLVDSNDHHADAWLEAFREFGIDPAREAIREQIGKGSDQLIPCFLSPEQIFSIGDQLDRRKGEIFKSKYLKKVKALPGVPPLFERLHHDKKGVVLATSGGAEETEYYIGLLGIERWIKGVVASDDVARSKPYPDLFHMVLDRFHWKSDEAVILGDTPYDAIAGAKIGLATIAVLTGGFTERSLRGAGAIEIYPDLPALLHAYHASCLGAV
jgi:HAD superfamily hydrolase (TIGR01509 family)